MSAFVLLWNPQRTPWATLDWMRHRMAEDPLYRPRMSWSTGSRKGGIKVGDLIFMRRVGEEPRGIIAAGAADSEIYVGEHWENEYRPCHYVDFHLYWIADPYDAIPVSVTHQCSGVKLDNRTLWIIQCEISRYRWPLTYGSPEPAAGAEAAARPGASA
jgi:hypothetical protein